MKMVLLRFMVVIIQHLTGHIRDYIHVSDLAKAHVLALNKIINDKSLSIYNLGNSKGYSIMEVMILQKK